MRRTAALILFSGLGFAVISCGDFNRTTGLIDIPTAEWLDRSVVRVITNGTFALGEDEYPAYLDFGVGYGLFGFGEVVLNAYTTKDYSAHLAVKLREDKGWAPALGFGIQDLTYRKWISSVGYADTIGFPDDVSYLRNGGRPTELFSFYFVGTKDLSPYGSWTLGFGRGRFVGYGPHSHWFNTDNFFRSDYTDTSQPINSFALGLFMGVKWKLAPGLFFMIEFDGRDGNAGLRYEHKYFDVALAGTHLDQIGGSPRLNPRISLGMSANTSWLYEIPTEGVIAGRVIDAKTNAPLQATISFPGTRIASVETSARGVFSVKVPLGTYTVQGNGDDYYWKQSRVTVLADQTVRCDFALAAKPPPEEVVRAQKIQEHLDKGLAYFMEDKVSLAVAEWEQVLRLDPDNEQAQKFLTKVRQSQIADHRSKALNYASRGQLTNAISEWEAVLSIDPFNAEARTEIADLRAKLATPKKAPPKKEPPRRQPPKKPPPQKASPEEINRLFRDGVSLFLKENYKQAISVFNKVLKLDPGHQEAKKYRDRAAARLKAMGG